MVRAGRKSPPKTNIKSIVSLNENGLQECFGGGEQMKKKPQTTKQTIQPKKKKTLERKIHPRVSG